MITNIESYSEWRKERNLEAYSLNPFKALGNFILKKVGENALAKITMQYPQDLVRLAGNCVSAAKSKVKDLDWLKKKEADFELIDEIRDELKTDPKMNKSQAKMALNTSKACILKINKFDEKEADKLARDFLGFLKRSGVQIEDTAESSQAFRNQQIK